MPRGEEACTRVRGLAYSIHSSRFLKAVNQTQKQQTGVVFMLSLYWFSMCFWNGKYWSVAVFGQCDTSWAYSHIALNITHIWIIFKTKCPQLCFAGRFIYFWKCSHEWTNDSSAWLFEVWNVNHWLPISLLTSKFSILNK